MCENSSTPEITEPGAQRELHLPPEILGHIFERVRAECERTSKPLHWMAVSHVSGYWRAIALGWPALWTSLTPTVAKKGLLGVFLERSGSMPLSIDIGNISPWVYETTLATQNHRIQTLTCNVRSQVVTLLDRPAPCLLNLQLRGQDDMFSVSETRILYSLLSSAPSMQNLELYCFSPKSFPWTIPFNSMRKLTLEGVGSAPPSSYTFSDVIEALSEMEALEYLCLEIDLPLHDRDVSYEVVRSPRLQVVRLTGRGDQFIVLWSLLEHHPICAIKLNITCSTFDIDNFRVAWTRYIALSDLESLVLISIDMSFRGEIRFTLISDDERFDMDTAFYMRIEWDSEVVNDAPLTALFTSMVPIENVEIISLSSRNDMDFPIEEFFAKLATRATNVKTLDLNDFNETLSALAFRILGGSNHDAPPMPRLERLELCSIVVDRNLLCETLYRRREAGMTLEEIRIHHCRMLDDDSDGAWEEFRKELMWSDCVGTIYL
ncbi:hypothetical protein PENSPDRAFT_746943 [Peniophora sp. CONT]|nr:hypothetical protein PENSPDRAFT_746943 [Peniophora sp. CONT]